MRKFLRLVAVAFLIAGINGTEPAFALTPIIAPLSNHDDNRLWDLVTGGQFTPNRDAVSWQLTNNVVYTHTRQTDWRSLTDVDPISSDGNQNFWYNKHYKNLVIQRTGSAFGFLTIQGGDPDDFLTVADVLIEGPEGGVLLDGFRLNFDPYLASPPAKPGNILNPDTPPDPNLTHDSHLRLRNAELQFGSGGRLTVAPTASLSIIAEFGLNTIINWKDDYDVAFGTGSEISVSPVAGLTLDNPDLKFAQPVTVNVQDFGLLTIQNGQVSLPRGTVQLTNGARLNLEFSSSTTKLESDRLLVDGGSKVNLGNTTSYVGNEVQLNGDSMVNIGFSANFEAAKLTSFSGNNQINNAGGTLSIGQISTCSDPSAPCNAPTINVQSSVDISVDDVAVTKGSKVIFSKTGSSLPLFITPTASVSVWSVDGAGSALEGNFDIRAGSALAQFYLTNGGTLSPGLSIGLIGIDGDVNVGKDFFGNLTNPGIFEMELDPTGSVERNDQLFIGGTLSGQGDVVVLHDTTTGPATATDYDGKTFNLIQAGTLNPSGGINATLNLVEGGSIPALIDFSVNQTPTIYQITGVQNVNTLVTNPQTNTKNRTGSANLLVNATNSGNVAIANALNTLTNAQVAPNLDSIHAEPYSSYMTVSIEQTDMVMNTVQNRAVWGGVFSSGGSSEVTQPGTLRRTWMEGAYVDGDVDGDNDLGNFDYTLTGLTIGQDLVATQDRAFGIYLSFGKQDMDEHDRAVQDLDGDMYHLGLYLNQANIGGWDLRGVLGYAYGDHSSKRRVTLSGSSASPSADFNSYSVYGGLKGTITAYQNEWVTLSPELGLNYIYYEQESFKESGDPDLSLKVDSADTQAIIASAGLNARFASFSETISIYPVAFVRYEHDFYADDNNEHEIDAALVAHPDYKQTFVGQNRGENAIIMGLGLGSEVTSALQVKGGFMLAEDTHGSEWGAGLNLQYAFQ